MRLKEIIKLPELSGFRLVSGSGGLDKEVNATEIVDFEFAEGVEFTREEMFYGNSLGISSLMFARNKPELLLDAVTRMDEMGIACLCYKPVFFRELPGEVLEYSERNSFPIFEITDDAFFEDIVLAVKKEAGMDMTETETEDALENILSGQLSGGDAERLKHMILPAKGRYVQAACFESPSDPGIYDRDHMIRYIRKLSLEPRYSDRVSLTRFRQGGLMIMTREEPGKRDMGVLMKDAAVACGLPLETAVTGLSMILESEDFTEAVNEAFWAMQAARVKGEAVQRYGDMGVYRLLAPEMSSGSLVRSSKDFLRPLTEEKAESVGLMETAREYVLANCDLNEAAERLFCHKNTVRYRIKRIHEMTAPHLSEEEFRESLVLAVRVLLLEGTLRNTGV